jgi:purine-cytosine permease-like protein
LPLARLACAGYIRAMNPLFATLIGLALLTVLGVLFAGLFSMARGGEFNKKYSNKLMRWRVGLQGVALVLLALAFLVGKD